MGTGNQTGIIRHMNTLPHHGFARLCLWDVVGAAECDRDRDWPDFEINSLKCNGTSQIFLRLTSHQVPANLGGSWLEESGDWELSYR